MNPWVTSMAVFANGGSPGVFSGNFIDNIPKNATEQPSRRRKLPTRATTAAMVTEAEGLGELSIKCLYITSRYNAEESGEGNAKEKRSLTFAFFSPKVPVEIFSEWRRHMALTKRQKEVLDYLVAFETKHGYAPSFEEIGKGLKLTSLATVHKHITTLEKKGFIRRGYNQSRSIEIIQLPKSVKDQVSDRKLQELPLVGRIAAGRPLEAVEERETISLGDFARGGNSFVLQVKGSSMIEDHIMDGDYVVCEQTQVANAGDIVVALIGGEDATLKRFYREGPGKIRLQPANSEMAPIMVAANDLKIQGRVIGVLRKY
jgi:repressor LexA